MGGNEAAHDSKFDRARILTSRLHYDKGNNRFWRNLFEYVYEQTAEEPTQQYRTWNDEFEH